ncbi:hypothetical protein SAMD00019534_011940 [Acytostelium subglobosum LB1]|uniref:hypothetical protein n=1 Tax=Acytostelium subglobosum LB1 TaxID=1410327 RepID=UPI0006448B22|nr:hypothetical protein SAMD00019534_011940 [Acytostelium subglobosum LB1]GAM18019.1 hypothetical protein SAMD00019534_011940 [Acytostelium subglobosum LB1]|eukprot:XP_012758615.1 hypothetical protein SAMD00019534_011940 [Acytostelium subglobosum LB1]
MTENGNKDTARMALRANRITFSAGAKLGGGLYMIEARWGHASISTGRKIYVFGGQGESLYSSLSAYDPYTSVWNELHTLGKAPSSRYGHSATLINTSDNNNNPTMVMIFGGRNNKKYLNDLYCLNLNTMSWSTFHFDKVEPDARAGHTCTFVPGAVTTSGGSSCNRLVLFGGCHSSKYLRSPYVLELPRSQNDTIRWVKPTTRGSGPGGRTGHTANHVKGTENVVIFGGYDGKRSFNDIYIFNLRDYSWSKVNAGGISPSPRNGHTANAVGNKYLVVHGGCNEANFLNDVHILDMERWCWLPQPSITGLTLFTRFHHTSNLLDSGEMVVYGGCSSGVLYSDMCSLDLTCLMDTAPHVQSSQSSSQQQQQQQPSTTATTLITSSAPPSLPPSPSPAPSSTATATAIATPSTEQPTHAKHTHTHSHCNDSISGNTITIVDYKHNPKYLESQLTNALSLLVQEQKQKTLLSTELQQSKEKHVVANQSIVVEQSKYESLEKEMLKLEVTLKKEQNQKSKALDTVNKLNNALKEKDSLIQSLQQFTSSKSSTIASKPRKSLNNSFNDADVQSTAEQQQQPPISVNHTFIDDMSSISSLSLSQSLKRENEELRAKLEQLQSNQLNIQALMNKQFHGGVGGITVEKILGDDLEHKLSMSDLEHLEEFHHRSLRSVGAAKQQLLQRQLLQLQKEKEESSTCLICADRAINIVLLPCKHRCLCHDCSDVLKLCPLCRSPITDKIQYY